MTFNEETGFTFSRTVRGVKEVAVIDRRCRPPPTPASSTNMRRRCKPYSRARLPPAILRRKDEEIPIYGPVGLFEQVTATGRKGIAMQRYKGLGEMNPNQLWETTLDINARSLLQVRIKEVDEANVLFDQLMGDVVEPRRQFIQDNALSASVDV